MLRIGRTAAYALTAQWLATEGRLGLPVVRVGRLLRVPLHELERLAGGPIEPSASPPEGGRECSRSVAIPPCLGRRRPL